MTSARAATIRWSPSRPGCGERGQGAVVVDELGVVDQHRDRPVDVEERRQHLQPTAVGHDDLGTARPHRRRAGCHRGEQQIAGGRPQLLGQQDERAGAARPTPAGHQHVLAGVEHEGRRTEVIVADPDRQPPRPAPRLRPRERRGRDELG